MRFVSKHALTRALPLAVAALAAAGCKSELAAYFEALGDAGNPATTSVPTPSASNAVTTDPEGSAPPALSSSAETGAGAPSISVTPRDGAPTSVPSASTPTMGPDPYVLEAGVGGAPQTAPAVTDAGPTLTVPIEAGAPDPFDVDASDRPGVVLLAMTPVSGSSGAQRTTDVVLLFDEAVSAADGALSLTAADGQLFETVPLNDPRVSIVGQRVYIDFDGILAGSTQYTLSIEPNALLGQGQTAYSGLTIEEGKSFTTEALVGPGEVGDGLVLWLDASNGASLRHDEQGVRLWADSSGNGHNLMQPTETLRPILAEGTSGAAVRFDGIDDVLPTAEQLAVQSVDGFVVWHASLIASTTQKSALFLNGTSFEVTHGHPRAEARDAVSARFVNGDSAAWYAATYFGFESERPQLWGFTLDGTSNALDARTLGGGGVRAVVNDDGPSVPEGTLSAPGDVLTVGNDPTNTSPLAGDISELILFSRVLSAAERQAIVEYLKAKWGIVFTPCDAGSEEGALSWSGRCVYVRSSTSTWTVGQSSCRDLADGWDLATPRSAADNAFITGLLYAEGRSNGWIGGSDRAAEGSWSWANDDAEFWSDDDAPEAYSNWSGGAPASSADNADCLALLASANDADGKPGDGRWSDRDCSSPRVAVCEGPVDE